MPSPQTGFPTTGEVLAELELHRGCTCPGCNDTVSGHDVVMSVAMGFKGAPRCLSCLAITFHRAKEDFRAYVLEYILSRECYTTAWNRADALEESEPGAGAQDIPATGIQMPDTPESPGVSVPEDVFWDAGPMQCADLVLELRLRLQSLSTGNVLKVRATDPAAPIDLPAWCRISRHELLHSEHPDYWIRQR